MSENVQVAVRVRPFNERERTMASTCCIRMLKEMQQTVITDPETNQDKSFTFDFSYNSYVEPDDPEFASQDTVWSDLGIKVLEHAWNGFNVSLFAYGQTGSGKSFSMVGYGTDKGIIPRACEEIFTRIDANTSDAQIKVEASMMEIYNERVKDLFNPSSDNLKIREHPRQGPYAEGLTRSAVSSYKEISDLMDAGIMARTTAATNMNATSSRAHTIFQIVVTQSQFNATTGKVMDRVSRINLIDLAGSERANSTGATGARLKEGAAINQSLSALGNCISALADIANGKKKNQVVPYRNSKLTHLLKDSLGGNSKTIMIAALSPASVNYSETLSTLRYADRAKQIKNQAIVNEDPNQMLIRQLKEELEQLRKAMLDSVGMRPSSRAGGDVFVDSNGNYVTQLPAMDADREKEFATMREQLEENQRLLRENEKTWNERLKETEEMARKRDEELKALGLVSSNNTHQRAQTEPHLINLNEDMMMSEKLLYFLVPGINRIGRNDAEQEQNIVIGGLGIHKEHALINWTSKQPQEQQQQQQDQQGQDQLHEQEGAGCTQDCVEFECLEDAKCFVNGEAIQKDQKLVLHLCDRLVLGTSNVFRVVIPSERPEGITNDQIQLESEFDWQFSIKELHRLQMQAEQEKQEQAEREKQEMDARVKKMEELIQMEQKTAEEKMVRQREEWEQQVAKLKEEMQHKEELIKSQMVTETDQDKKRLAEQLALQESKLAGELVKAEMTFEKKQIELVTKQKELEASLQKQMREAKLLGEQKERERLERLRFDDELLACIPLVNEANSMADELKKNTTFALKLVTNGPDLKTFGLLSNAGDEQEQEKSGGGGGGGGPTAGNPRTTSEEAIVSWPVDLDATTSTLVGGISTELKVQLNFQESGTYRMVMWDIDQFKDNLFAMKDMYQVFIQHNRMLNQDLWSDEDPFYEPPAAQLIGKAYSLLRSTLFGCKFTETTPIIDHLGKTNGTLKFEIHSEVLSHEWQAAQHRITEFCTDDWSHVVLPSIHDFRDAMLRITIVVDSLKGIPGKLCKNCFVAFKFMNDTDAVQYKSNRVATPSVDPVIQFTTVIEKPITSSLISFLTNSPLEFEVYGMVPSNNLSEIAHLPVSTPIPEEVDESGEVPDVFGDANGGGDGSAKSTIEREDHQDLKKRKRRQAAKQMSANMMDFYAQQLADQERALMDNTQELETKIQELEQLKQQLAQEQETRSKLQDTLEETLRTNQMLQSRLQDQIVKSCVTRMLSERRGTISKSFRRPPSVKRMMTASNIKSGIASAGTEELESAMTKQVATPDLSGPKLLSKGGSVALIRSTAPALQPVMDTQHEDHAPAETSHASGKPGGENHHPTTTNSTTNTAAAAAAVATTTTTTTTTIATAPGASNGAATGTTTPIPAGSSSSSSSPKKQQGDQKEKGGCVIS